MAFQHGPATARILLHNIRHGEKSGGRLMIAAASVAVVSFMIAAAALALFFVSKTQDASQLSQIRQQLAAAQSADQSAISQVQASSDSQYRALSGKITTIGSAVAYFGQFTSTCTQDFTGPVGPAEYWFPCANKLPG